MDHPRRAHQRSALRGRPLPICPQKRPLDGTDDRFETEFESGSGSGSNFEPDEFNDPVKNDRNGQPKFALADSSTSEQDFYRQKIQQYLSAGPTVANHSERTAKMVQAEEKKWIQYVPNAYPQLARTDTRQGLQRILRVLTLVKHYATRTRLHSKHTFSGGSVSRAHASASQHNQELLEQPLHGLC